MLFPFICVFFYALFIALPSTRSAILWTLQENHPVELLTFLFLLVGGVKGLVLAWQTRRCGERRLVFAFYAVFSVGLLLTAMEEIAWGQWFFGFPTPAFLNEINVQGEITLHNLRGLQGHSEFFRLTYGLGGLIGVSLSSYQYFRKIGTPVILLPFFSIITILAGIDLYNDYFRIQENIDFAVRRSSELVEMLIGISGFTFVWLNARMLAAEWKKGTQNLSF